MSDDPRLKALPPEGMQWLVEPFQLGNHWLAVSSTGRIFKLMTGGRLLTLIPESSSLEWRPPEPEWEYRAEGLDSRGRVMVTDWFDSSEEARVAYQTGRGPLWGTRVLIRRRPKSDSKISQWEIVND